MSYSTVPKIRRDGKITLLDGTTPTAVSLEVEYEDGNLTLNGLETKEAQTIIRNRGVISTVRKGDSEAPSSGSFSIHMRQFMDSSNAGSVLDFINKTNNYSSNVSTGATGTPYIEFYTIDIQYDVEGTDHGDAKDHRATLSKCVVTASSFSESDPNQLTFEFVCYGGITFA